mgnify:CR=1 FL=1
MKEFIIVDAPDFNKEELQLLFYEKEADFYHPQTKEELTDLMKQHPQAVIIIDYTPADMMRVDKQLQLQRKEANAGSGKEQLTKTELQILKEIALGKTTKEIALEKFVSFHTVNTHRKNIFRKLGVNNVHDAVKYALRAGIVDLMEYYI